MEAHYVLGFIFFLTVLSVSNKINTSYIRLVSMCSLGTVLWLTLAPAGHLCSLNGVTVEINLCATCHIFALPSFAGQNSVATSISPSSLLSQLFKLFRTEVGFKSLWNK